jgi:hypothetical protein
VAHLGYAISAFTWPVTKQDNNGISPLVSCWDDSTRSKCKVPGPVLATREAIHKFACRYHCLPCEVWVLRSISCMRWRRLTGGRPLSQGQVASKWQKPPNHHRTFRRGTPSSEELEGESVWCLQGASVGGSSVQSSNPAKLCGLKPDTSSLWASVVSSVKWGPRLDLCNEMIVRIWCWLDPWGDGICLVGILRRDWLDYSRQAFQGCTDYVNTGLLTKPRRGKNGRCALTYCVVNTK